MRRTRMFSDKFVVGDTLDWWRISKVINLTMVELTAEMRLPGKATLSFQLDQTSKQTSLTQTASINTNKIIPLGEVELGINYAIVITTNSGLWRYKIGDTIKFTSLKPYRIKVTGRTKHFINAFGEELIVENAEVALAKAAEKNNCKIKDYTAAPVYMLSLIHL